MHELKGGKNRQPAAKGVISTTSKSGNCFIDNPQADEKEKTVLMVRNIPCRLTPLAILNLLLSNYVVMADSEYRQELSRLGWRFGSQEENDSAERQNDIATANTDCKEGDVLPGVWSRYNLHPRDFQYRLDPFVVNAINFFHVPKAGESSKNLGYCFISFRSAVLAERFWEILQKRRISSSSVKTLDIQWALDGTRNALQQYVSSDTERPVQSNAVWLENANNDAEMLDMLERIKEYWHVSEDLPDNLPARLLNPRGKGKGYGANSSGSGGY